MQVCSHLKSKGINCYDRCWFRLHLNIHAFLFLFVLSSCPLKWEISVVSNAMLRRRLHWDRSLVLIHSRLAILSVNYVNISVCSFKVVSDPLKLSTASTEIYQFIISLSFVLWSIVHSSFSVFCHCNILVQSFWPLSEYNDSIIPDIVCFRMHNVTNLFTLRKMWCLHFNRNLFLMLKRNCLINCSCRYVMFDSYDFEIFTMSFRIMTK